MLPDVCIHLAQICPHPPPSIQRSVKLFVFEKLCLAIFAILLTLKCSLHIDHVTYLGKVIELKNKQPRKTLKGMLGVG